ncbi:hypothetical protein K504DRAFT_456813 [Pleomassaria siparia CBS 279.74]|uniref:Uncharacterized protein n=1 Tax=Pleomassaria siparia CBS 279.74 TaxID=1314801 RepID=A0A6G1KPR5_9PLEO|nr:hypothetical protein K504DRAFT_456813 [Pleomassaria siparia CBS 279.74]
MLIGCCIKRGEKGWERQGDKLKRERTMRRRRRMRRRSNSRKAKKATRAQQETNLKLSGVASCCQ